MHQHALFFNNFIVKVVDGRAKYHLIQTADSWLLRIRVCLLAWLQFLTVKFGETCIGMPVLINNPETSAVWSANLARQKKIIVSSGSTYCRCDNQYQVSTSNNL